MTTAKRWNYDEHCYKEVELPEGSSAFEIDMDKKVACAECGKKLKFGDGYTSRRIHTEHGFGYAVCKRCYNLERIDEQIAEQRQKKHEL